MKFILFAAMFFGGGLIPTYMLCKNLGILDSFSVCVLPSLLNLFFVLMIRTSILQMPPAVVESAMLDGANELVILFRIILPLSSTIVAYVTPNAAVYQWNAWQDKLYYTNGGSLRTLQYIMMEVLLKPEAKQALTRELVRLRQMGIKNTVNPQSVRIPGDSNEKIGMLLATDSLPDLIAVPTGQMVNQYRDSGLVIDLMPYLQRSAPTVYEVLSSEGNYRVLDSLVEEDGSLYGLANEFDIVWSVDEVIENTNNPDADYIWYPWATSLYVRYRAIDTYAKKTTAPEQWYEGVPGRKPRRLRHHHVQPQRRMAAVRVRADQRLQGSGHRRLGQRRELHHLG